LLGVLAGCGGASAEGPLTVPIGLSRDQTAGELRRHDYCAGKDFVSPKAISETFPRCDTPGHEFSQSWVVTHFEQAGGRVVKIQRWERYEDEERALERFNQLVEKRSAASGPPTDETKSLLQAEQDLPPGTRAWVAFPGGDHALVGVYLLTPTPPENARVLEEVVEVFVAR
jgi:hypothetical protein